MNYFRLFYKIFTTIKVKNIVILFIIKETSIWKRKGLQIETFIAKINIPFSQLCCT